ncbi:hypothetical protein MRB53_034400 [Persea americana]|uniref:Uncharacterized protein n=1 Tax=Persea americana TaxID=3435 RepID=A0ACC2K267_PERAE|nr:hypothetical protein MRB53_034400 [Persea americana]
MKQGKAVSPSAQPPREAGRDDLEEDDGVEGHGHASRAPWSRAKRRSVSPYGSVMWVLLLLPRFAGGFGG